MTSPKPITLEEQIEAVKWAEQMCVDRNLCGPYLALGYAIATLRALQKKQTCNHGVVVSDGKRWQCLKCEGGGIVP